ncbi:hypothetical protein LCGC14_2075210 [marine sediment metagenome]|uniref:Uncharacterized protein n=1 Tax=marine sediment metagenome TaxID=412755 RepID=A0A0F9HEA6_9ZZZZ
MAKTDQDDVWSKPIKEIGNGYIELIAACVDFGATWQAGHGLALSTTAGSLTIFVTADPDWIAGLELAETVVDDDVFCLVRKKGAKILHNQKLSAAASIGSVVYKTTAGVWALADHGVAVSLLGAIGIVCGPADRITATVIKNINDAFSTTEPVDVCV